LPEKKAINKGLKISWQYLKWMNPMNLCEEAQKTQKEVDRQEAQKEVDRVRRQKL
jgi:hypothetical protein